MTQHNFVKLFSNAFGKSLFGMPNASFDIQALLDIQERNLVAFSEIQKLTFESIQAVTQRQTKHFSKTVQDNSSLIKGILFESSSEKKTVRHADLVKNNYDTSITTCQDLSEIIDLSGKEAINILNDRITSSITEFQSALNNTRSDSNKIAKKKAA